MNRIDLLAPSEIKVLIACEESQVVCSAFRCLGFCAYSCDIVPTRGEFNFYHIIQDAAQVVKGNNTFVCQDGSTFTLNGAWDLVIAHPPCTMLTHSSAPALSAGLHSLKDIEDAAKFFLLMLNCPANHIAVENPAPMHIANLPKYNQIIQPYEFGHPFSKRVCLWLKDLPPLFPEGGYYVNHKQWLRHCSSRPGRRAQTFTGIAYAMANQWGSFVQREKTKLLKTK